jgi:nickel/cobalt transporter (NicO) family protein
VIRRGRLRAAAGALLLGLVLLLSSPAARADPFHHGGAAVAPAAASGPVMAIGGRFMAWLAERQHRLNEAISDAFHDVETSHSGAALALVLGLAFVYGMVHAVGPGHGKSVVASYFVAHHARWTSGILMGSLISLLQGLSATVLVGLLAILLQAKQLEILDRTTVVGLVSYGLIVAVGALMFYRAATGKLHAHDHDHDGIGHVHHPRATRLDPRLVLATGLTPCASAIIILLFALANDAFGLGVAAVAVLSVGMAVTISAIGVLAVLGRRAMLAVIDTVGVEAHRLEERLAMVAAAVIVGVSGLMMYDAWVRL